MTAEEINALSIDEINAKLSELENEERGLNEKVETAESEEIIEGATEEKRGLLELKKELVERKAELEEIEKRSADAKALEQGAIVGAIIEERKESNKMTIAELRNSNEYINAYAEYVKTGKDEEIRSLLTTNAVDGTIAVPDMVLDIVKTAWDEDQIMSLVNKTNLAGNLKVNFEISGTDAVVHTEGSGAVDEEVLTEGIATIVPAFIKKWVSISDEVMAMRGSAFLEYIYAELTHKIVKKMADTLVGMIAALPAVATATTPDAAKITSAPTVGTIAEAIANLSDEASNPVVIMNKLTWAAFKSVQYGNNYGVDPFEGLTVVFNNTLPAYGAASANDVYAIVGDLGEGAIANFPEGDAVRFTFDELSRKKEDLVEVLGKVYVGLGVVASKAFTLIAKPTNG